jgi:hypothetical protein
MNEATGIVAAEKVATTGRRPVTLKLPSRGTLANVGFVVAAIAVYVGWTGRTGRPIDAAEGIGYVLGIAGGIPMVLLLLYSFRKRLSFMRYLGPIRHWFRAHMMFGVTGPVIILYHCNFQVGSLNSQVALYCTLLVASSGLVGRYLYAKIHHGLYGRKASLRELTTQLEDSSRRLSSGDGFIDDIREELRGMVEQSLSPADSITGSLSRPVVMAFQTRWLYYRMSWAVRRKLIARSVASPTVAQHRERLETATRRFLAQHLRQIRRVSQFNACERLFSLWHVIHVPFFCMMVLSVIVHILAVHMY